MDPRKTMMIGGEFSGRLLDWYSEILTNEAREVAMNDQGLKNLTLDMREDSLYYVGQHIWMNIQVFINPMVNSIQVLLFKYPLVCPRYLYSSHRYISFCHYSGADSGPFCRGGGVATKTRGGIIRTIMIVANIITF